ncbi:ATP-dependent protease [Sphingorhabdus soli]|uniref:ATP-dependent protease n=1 Tax=Flavisphingopyxis soli TaxID=2601267 RepID=A0A5C6UN51_9SPHN|nr:LON peptidase substrate-binding domain-containing protein [Sphingorhabdus soli]TXC73571.1 ATP-dependent protease [Sphingorhabdus soli]
MSTPVDKTKRIAIFPLGGAILFPGLQLPLHIFEPRYRAMVSKALASDRLIGLVQPRTGATNRDPDRPALFDMGCIGKITDVEALDDGCFNIVLSGEARFRVEREVTRDTPYRVVEAAIEAEAQGEAALASSERAALEHAARTFAMAQGYVVDWDSVANLDDRTLVNGISQVAPFDAAAKQALLEAETLRDRSELAIQLMQFFGRHDGDDKLVTLQ